MKIVRRAEFDDDRPYEREFSGIRKFEPISRTHEGFVDLLQVGRNDAEGWFYYVMELADTISEPSTESRLQPANHSPARARQETDSALPAKAGTPNPDVRSYHPRTLAAEVKLRGALPLDECLQIAISLARALAELHRNDLVHRDIKPSNIIFVGGVPKLADIGLVASATDARSFVGTEGFIPPEGPGTPQADLYSLGILLYVIATGKTHRDFPEPPSNLATRSEKDRQQFLELTAIIHKACQANPRDRYSSAEALLADLKLLDAGKSVQRRHSLQRARSWTWKAAAVLCALVFVYGLIHNQRVQDKALAKPNPNSFEGSGTTNRAAWEAYARAGAWLNVYTPSGLSNAVSHLERALEMDPSFARAWDNLSSSLAISVDKAFHSGADLLPRARFAAERASNLDPSRARAYHWLAFSILGLEYDLARAEPIFRKAIQLDPKEFAYRHNFAYFLCFYGRLDESEAILNNELRDDPSFGYAHACLAQIYGARSHLPEALKAFGECILLKPTFPGPYLERGEFLWTLNRRTEAVNDWLRFIELDGLASVNREEAALLRTRFGNSDPGEFMRELIELLEERRAEGKFVSAYDLAKFHALSGNKTRALDYLEQAVDEHRPFTLSAKMHIAFKNLRDEPRFHAVLRRLKLEQ